MTPEMNQKVTDLRRRMLENQQKGLKSEAGITEEELKEAIAAIRGNRTIAAAAGGTASAKKKKATKAQLEAAPVTAEVSSKLKGLFGDLG